MITIEKQPDPISMADQALLELSTDDNIISDGIAGEFVIEFPGNQIPALNSIVNITYDVHLLTFRIVATATDGFDIERGDGTLIGNVNSFVPKFIAAMQSNFLLNRDFSFTSTPNGDVIVTANNVGIRYNIQFNFTSAAFSSVIVSPEDPAFLDNYSLRVVLNAFVKNGTPVRFDFQKPLVNQKSTFRFISALLGGISQPVKPELDNNSVDTSTALVRYNYRFADAQGVPPIPGKLSALFSGLAVAGGNPEGINANTYFSAGRNLLSYLPTTIHLKEDFYLVMPYFHLAASEFEVSFRLTFMNGSVDPFTNVSLVSNPAINDMFLLPVSPELILAMLGYDISEIFKIEVLIVNPSNQPLTRTTSIIVDHSGFVEANKFRFKNSFGVYEILNTYGLSTRSEAFTGTTAESLEGPLKFNSRRTSIFTVNTGHLTREMSRYLIDFLLSEDVEFFYKSKWVKVSISPFNFTVESLRMGNINNPEIQVNFAKSEFYA
jgi:hypothetical protein